MKIQILRVIVLFGVVAPAYAQKATELYTPIGRSPGLSGRVTVTGTIESLDEASGTVTILGTTGPATAVVTDRCHVYLDRSKLRERNEYGKLDDLKVGRRVEILYENRVDSSKGPAEWIKVEIAER